MVLNIEIDELTPCLRERATGNLLEIKVADATLDDISALSKEKWIVPLKREKH